MQTTIKVLEENVENEAVEEPPSMLPWRGSAPDINKGFEELPVRPFRSRSISDIARESKELPSTPPQPRVSSDIMRELETASPENLLEWIEQAKAEIKRRDTKCDELKAENQEFRAKNTELMRRLQASLD